MAAPRSDLCDRKRSSTEASENLCDLCVELLEAQRTRRHCHVCGQMYESKTRLFARLFTFSPRLRNSLQGRTRAFRVVNCSLPTLRRVFSAAATRTKPLLLSPGRLRIVHLSALECQRVPIVPDTELLSGELTVEYAPQYGNHSSGVRFGTASRHR